MDKGRFQPRGEARRGGHQKGRERVVALGAWRDGADGFLLLGLGMGMGMGVQSAAAKSSAQPASKRSGAAQ
jgi:hypothetical protein